MVLPFGLLSMPRVSSKVLFMVAAHLHRQTLDFPTPWWLPAQRSILQRRLGLQLNTWQSTLTLVQDLEFIGAYLYAVMAKPFFASHMFITLVNLVTTAQVSPQTSARNCLQLLTCGSWHLCNKSHWTSHALRSQVAQNCLFVKQTV